jgi:glucose/arabinose dehydrogenase
MAFHPGFAANRQVFLSYTRRGTGRGLTSVISRFIADGSGAVLDSGSEQPILTLDQPFRNHNGGHIMFGPDGFLYIGFGDGGSRADPQGNGQNVNTLLGAILRIDVDGGRPYAIPPDNPFAGGGGRPEIYAWGLRNPWRFTFDRATGDLWLGDVGQNDIEEIDLIVRGGNYGWNLREGTAIFRRGGPTGGLIGPVGQYRHNLGCSITGGYVYDGGAVAGLGGAYVFGDFCSGRIWAQFAAEEGRPIRQLVDTDLSITSFGQANDGRLFVLDLRGAVFQLVGP